MNDLIQFWIAASAISAAIGWVMYALVSRNARVPRSRKVRIAVVANAALPSTILLIGIIFQHPMPPNQPRHAWSHVAEDLCAGMTLISLLLAIGCTLWLSVAKRAFFAPLICFTCCSVLMCGLTFLTAIAAGQLLAGAGF